MKTFLLVLSLAALLGAISCDKLSGEGPLVTESRDTGPFTGVESDISGSVTLYGDGPAGVELSGQKNILDVLETKVTGSVVHIYMNHHVQLRSHKPVQVTVRAPELHMAAVNGSGHLRIVGTRHAEEMKLSVAGSGDLLTDSLQLAGGITGTLSGSGSLVIGCLVTPQGVFRLGGSSKIQAETAVVETLEIALSGSGNADLGAVTSREAVVRVSGSGNATIGYTDTLLAELSGSGNLRYRGSPHITSDISGSGKLTRR